MKQAVTSIRTILSAAFCLACDELGATNPINRIVRTLFFAGILVLSSAPPAYAVNFNTTFTEALDNEQPPQPVLEIRYYLEGDFGYPVGYILTLDHPRVENMTLYNRFLLPEVGWSYLRFYAEPNLGLKGSLERYYNGAGPNTQVGGYTVYWTGTGPTPSYQQKYRVYDLDFNVVESETFLVPEPDPTLAQSFAFLTLLLLLRWKKKEGIHKPIRSRRQFWIFGFLLLALPTPADATIIDIDPEDVITHSVTYGNIRVEYTTVSYERQNLVDWDHHFDLSVENLGGTSDSFTLLVSHPPAPCTGNLGTAILNEPFSFTLDATEKQFAAEQLLLAHYRPKAFNPNNVRFQWLIPTGADTAIATIDSYIDSYIGSQTIDLADPNWRLSVSKPEGLDPVYNYDKNYYWNIETSWGTLKIKLYPFVAPNHVTNAIYLTRLGFYDTLTFHRAITGFMVQGGDPTGGTGGDLTNYSPGLTGECSYSAVHSKRGILSTANKGEGTDSTQFFITYAATPWLDGKHTVYGEVVDGFAALDALEARSTPDLGTPSETLTIISATITVE